MLEDIRKWPSRSLPSRERGLKFFSSRFGSEDRRVAPFAGAWIEITKEKREAAASEVAPFAGAWIEIFGSP